MEEPEPNLEQKEKTLLLLARMPRIQLTGQGKVLHRSPEKEVILEANKFAVKYDYVNNYDTQSTIIHEAVVGLYATNYLRSIVPNFAQVYAAYLDIKCNNKKCNVVVYEYIAGQTFYEFLRDPEVKTSKIKMIMLQLFLALNIAYKFYDFTHYDLHARNIIIVRYDQEIQLNYENYTIKTKVVPVIIDYGRTHIKLAGTDYGLVVEPNVSNDRGTVDNIGFWPHDVFQVLMAIYSYCTLDGQTAISKCRIRSNEVMILELKREVEELKIKLRHINPSLVKDVIFRLEEKEKKITLLVRDLPLEKRQVELFEHSWKERRLENLIEIVIELSSYLLMESPKSFNFQALIERFGEFLHLPRNPQNAKINFEDFINYAIKLI